MPTNSKNMTLITTYWGENKTFKMIPTDKDCPYLEVLFDVATKMLVVFSKEQVEKMQMITKLDPDGEPIKKKKLSNDGYPFQRRQVSMKTSQEYFLIEEKEIIDFIERFADNKDEFDYKSFIQHKEDPKIIQQEKPSLVMADGKEIPKQVKK